MNVIQIKFVLVEDIESFGYQTTREDIVRYCKGLPRYREIKNFSLSALNMANDVMLDSPELSL